MDKCNECSEIFGSDTHHTCPPKSLDTPTIDEILANICDQICSPDKLCEYCCEAKQALLQWHKSKARSYVPEKPSNELTHMSIAEQHGYEQAIDQTLKAIEESK